MNSSTTSTELLSPDTSITKCEVFDVDFAKQLLDDKGICKEEKDKLRRYFKNKKYNQRDNTYYHETTYKLGRHCKHEFLGRLCALRGESLQALGKDIRNAIAGEFYFDLDFVNAQPTLLKQYAEKNGWKVDAVSKYIEQREELLTSVCDTLNIERWEAKDKVISIFFGCGPSAIDGMPCFFTEELYPEMRKIMKNNWDHNKSTLKWLEKHPNHVGKGMADILQTEERKCLIALDRALAKRNRSLDVLIHDGGLVRKKTDEKEFPTSLMRELENEIEKETGYKMSLAVKPMKSIFEKKIDDENDYNEKKTEFEKTHFKLKSPPRYVRLVGASIQYLTDHELTFLYRNDKCGEETFISKWIQDPDIRTYECLEFKPNQEASEGCYNLFRGFPIEPKEGDWSIIRELVWDLSGRNQQVFDFLMKWTAHMFQKPYEKPGVVPIFSSIEEGVGKDTYGDIVLKPLLGEDYYYSTADAENDFFGRFTTHLQNKLFVKLEEMNYDVMNRNDDKLKGWITCESRSYEEKGIPKSVPIRSYHRFMGTTNEACPVKLTKTFRRYLLINPFQGNAGNAAHWERMYKELKKTEVLQAFLHHLLSMDITNWNPREKVETDALNEARQAQAPPHARFFQMQVQESYEENMSWYAKNILEMINSQCKFPYTPYKLAQELKQYPHKKEETKRGVLYTFRVEEVKKMLQDKNWWVDGF